MEEPLNHAIEKSNIDLCCWCTIRLQIHTEGWLGHWTTTVKMSCLQHYLNYWQPSQIQVSWTPKLSPLTACNSSRISNLWTEWILRETELKSFSSHICLELNHEESLGKNTILKSVVILSSDFQFELSKLDCRDGETSCVVSGGGGGRAKRGNGGNCGWHYTTSPWKRPRQRGNF